MEQKGTHQLGWIQSRPNKTLNCQLIATMKTTVNKVKIPTVSSIDSVTRVRAVPLIKSRDVTLVPIKLLSFSKFLQRG